MTTHAMSRRAALAAAASALAWPLIACAQNTPLRYGLPGAAADRELGLMPRAECTVGTLQQTEGPFYTPQTPRRVSLREPGTSGALRWPRKIGQVVKVYSPERGGIRDEQETQVFRRAEGADRA